MNVSLRPLEDRDLDAIYQQVTDPESVRMAAFTAEDQTDRRAYLERPLYARAASDNVGSLRVLEKAGFQRVGVNRDFAPGRGEEIEETILRLD
jgi:L-amino acid N-acyltransferase YncA